jgi:hypothetical protein
MRLASYLGLTPSEQTSGGRRRQGAITKAGSGHARRLLVEAAWHYRRAPRMSLTLRRRQAGQQPAAIDAAWRAQLRLHRRCPPRRRARQAPHDRRGRRRVRAVLLCLGDRQPARLSNHTNIPFGGGGGGRRVPPGTRDAAMSTNHIMLARSILDRGPGTSHSPS